MEMSEAIRRRPGRGSQLTDDERAEMRLLLMRGDLSMSRIASITGRDRETVAAVLNADDDLKLLRAASFNEAAIATMALNKKHREARQLVRRQAAALAKRQRNDAYRRAHPDRMRQYAKTANLNRALANVPAQLREMRTVLYEFHSALVKKGKGFDPQKGTAQIVGAAVREYFAPVVWVWRFLIGRKS